MNKVAKIIQSKSDEQITQMLQEIKEWQQTGILASPSATRDHANEIAEEINIDVSSALHIAETNIYREASNRWLKSNSLTNISISPLKWKEDKLYIGKVKVGSAHHTAFIAKGDPKCYQASCFLQGIKDNLGKYETQDEAKAKVEAGVKRFFELLNQEKLED